MYQYPSIQEDQDMQEWIGGTMELCERCDRLIDMKNCEGDYYKDKPYCEYCLELVRPEEDQ